MYSVYGEDIYGVHVCRCTGIVVFLTIEQHRWYVVKLNKQCKDRSSSRKLGAYDGVDCTARAPNYLQVTIYMRE